MRKLSPGERHPPRLDPDTPRSPWYDPRDGRPALYLPPEREPLHFLPPWQVFATIGALALIWTLGWLSLAILRFLLTLGASQ